MTRKVIVGGFASSESHMKSVLNTLSENLDEEIYGITFINAIRNPELAEKFVHDAHVLTHSAGMFAIRDTSPRTITAVAPPLPTAPLSLVKRAGKSGVGLMASSLISQDRRLSVRDVGVATARAFLEHPVGHVRSIGDIAVFNAIDAAIAAKEAGVRTRLAFMDQDKFFQPTPQDTQRAHQFGISVLRLKGHHDEFLINPYETYVELEARHWADHVDDIPLQATA